MGWERDGGTFENFDKVETQTNTKFRFLLTQNDGEFYSDAELM